MTTSDFEQPADPTAYGAARAAAWRAHMEASAAMSTAAEMERHAALSPQLRNAHRGLYDHADGFQMAAEVADRPVTVGGDWGQAREIPRNGGTFDHHNEGPAPQRRDLRHVGQPPGQQATGPSPLLAFMQNRQEQ